LKTKSRGCRETKLARSFLLKAEQDLRLKEVEEDENDNDDKKNSIYMRTAGSIDMKCLPTSYKCRNFLFSTTFRPASGSPSLICNEKPIVGSQIRSSASVVNGRRTKLTTDIHLVLSSRMMKLFPLPYTHQQRQRGETLPIIF
jgi:hypothetical protein